MYQTIDHHEKKKFELTHRVLEKDQLEEGRGGNDTSLKNRHPYTNSVFFFKSLSGKIAEIWAKIAEVKNP